MVNRVCFPELKLSKEVAIQGFTLFEVGALVGTLLWGWLSDLANGRRALVACIALALIIATLGVYQHASNQYVYRRPCSRSASGVWSAAADRRGGSGLRAEKRSALPMGLKAPSPI